MTSQSARAGMIAITEGDNGAVILPKQTISAKTEFIQVKLSNNAVFTYKIPDSEPLTLESGKKYTYKITVNQSGLSVTSKINDWKTEVKTGNAEMD